MLWIAYFTDAPKSSGGGAEHLAIKRQHAAAWLVVVGQEAVGQVKERFLAPRSGPPCDLASPPS